MFIVCQKRMLTLATGAVRQSGLYTCTTISLYTYSVKKIEMLINLPVKCSVLADVSRICDLPGSIMPVHAVQPIIGGMAPTTDPTHVFAIL